MNWILWHIRTYIAVLWKWNSSTHVKCELKYLPLVMRFGIYGPITLNMLKITTSGKFFETPPRCYRLFKASSYWQVNSRTYQNLHCNPVELELVYTYEQKKYLTIHNGVKTLTQEHLILKRASTSCCQDTVLWCHGVGVSWLGTGDPDAIFTCPCDGIWQIWPNNPNIKNVQDFLDLRKRQLKLRWCCTKC